MLLVTARRKDSSLSVGVATASDAVKVSDLEGQGYVAFVFDCAGCERSIEELRAQSRGEDANTPSASIDRP